MDSQYNTQFVSSTEWSFGLLELEDLNRAVEVSMDAFFTPRLVLKTEGMAGLELALASGAVNAFTSFEKMDAWFSNYIGFKTRSEGRLKHPDLKISKYSFILAATEKVTGIIAGIVEVSLEEADGNLAPPIQSPFKGSPVGTEEAYLCNLSIDRAFRRRGLGRIMVQICEKAVQKYWGKETMYLHVERKNVPAQKLYFALGYSPAEIKIPLWRRSMLGLDDILYLKRDISLPFIDEKDTNSPLKIE